MRLPEDADRDFVAGALIVDEDSVLMIDHGKYGFWLMPGGHVEEGETPDETALRETREETGIEAELIDPFEPEIGQSEAEYRENLPRPFNLNFHRIEEGHWHCDFQYLARVKNEGEASHGHEHDGLKWFSMEELQDENFEIPEDLRNTAINALELLD